VGERCHDLLGAQVSSEFEVLMGSAPAPEGGSGLAGTYDLYRTEVYIGAGVASDTSEACQDYADSQGGISTSEWFTAQRMVENAAGVYSAEVFVDVPEFEFSAQFGSIVEVDSSGTKLDLVVGSSQCVYTSDPTGEEIERVPAVREPDYEPIGFTVTGDSLILVSTLARSVDVPAPPDCQRVEYYRRR
jgi:hypothetical protein